jgi:hypothetical protein
MSRSRPHPGPPTSTATKTPSKELAMELFGLTIGADLLKAGAGLAGAGLVAWRGRKVKRAVERITRLVRFVADARATSSPGGRTFTQEEVETIIDETLAAIKALSPFLARIFAK